MEEKKKELFYWKKIYIEVYKDFFYKYLIFFIIYGFEFIGEIILF